MNRGKTVRDGIVFLLILLSLASTAPAETYAASYNMRYDLGFSGVPFAGGVIVLTSNFTNTGQLVVRLTSITFASDFWPNGTRQVNSGLQFNLTAGMYREVDTPVLVPTSASLGNHLVTGTASWQYSNSSGWFYASPIATSTKITVSQTIGSLFAGLATALIIGLVVAVAAILFVVIGVVMRTRRKQMPKPSPASIPSRLPLPV